MGSGKHARFDGVPDDLVSEQRIVDTIEMRLSEFEVKTHSHTVPRLRDHLMHSLEEFDIAADARPTQICMALEEALANAFYHGTLELDSELKEDGTTTFWDLARERSERSPWKDRSLRVTELVTPYGVWITISDEGHGFDVSTAIKQTKEPINARASGRGLVMMRAFTDELLFNPKGNEVTLVIYNSGNRDISELLQERATSRKAAGKQSLI